MFEPKRFALIALIFVIGGRSIDGQSGWFLRVAVEPETELCGPERFFCPSTRRCLPRTIRCSDPVAGSFCPQQSRCYRSDWIVTSPATVTDEIITVPVAANGEQRKKLADDAADQTSFLIYRAFSSIVDSAFSGTDRQSTITTTTTTATANQRTRRHTMLKAMRTLWHHPWRHSFVQYRGFVYEFGKYGVQELDINDPMFKYDREWTYGWQNMGVCSCDRDQVWKFIRAWNSDRPDYVWHSNNCHHFSNAFVQYLIDGCSTIGNLTLIY